MKLPLQIGITGGIGSGKSLVCKIFQHLGVPVYDADNRAKNLITTDASLIHNIKDAFGTTSYHEDGSLNRAHISNQVFNDANKLKLLNSLVHPRVKEDFKIWTDEYKFYSYVIKEAALLFETNSYTDLDKVIAVYAPESLRIKRVLHRDTHRNEEQIKAIISSQMPEEEKKSKADFIIVNDERELIIPQILKLHNHFVNTSMLNIH